MQWGCVIPWCVNTGELKEISIPTQQFTINTDAPIEHFPAAADVGRESRRDTRRNLRSAHWHLLLLRSRLVRRPHLSSFCFRVTQLMSLLPFP